jgi:3-phosphoshikimate 1-carboxyvinyltransferase
LIDFISKPVLSIQGNITVPGDKSISHRAIILGSIAEGTTIIDGFLEGEDCLATLGAFQSMGVRISRPKNAQVVIEGVGKYGLKKPQQPIDCGNSGTSMRLLSGLLAAQKFDSILVGDESLTHRPMQRISQPLADMGAQMMLSASNTPPVYITGNQPLKGIDYVMPMASAQVKSCLLLAGLYAEGKTSITEIGISRDHTERMLKTFSYPLSQKGRTLQVDSSSVCKATSLLIPGDISSAAFFMVAASIIPGSDVVIRDVGFNPTRTGVIEILKQMGADISVSQPRHFGGEPVADIRIKHAPLVGIDIDKILVPLAIDEFPIIFIAAACAKGETRLTGAHELRVKESDRIGTMVQGLQALGIHAEATLDGVHIQGGIIQGGCVNSFGDHRIAMSFAIAGAVAKTSIIINNCANVATSFPTFIAIARALNLNIEVKQ